MRRSTQTRRRAARTFVAILVLVAIGAYAYGRLEGTNSDRVAVLSGVAALALGAWQAVSARREPPSAPGTTLAPTLVTTGADRAMSEGRARSISTIVSRTRSWLDGLDGSARHFVELVVRQVDDGTTQVNRLAASEGLVSSQRLTDVAQLQRVVVLGDPGAGKSTCLRELARRALEPFAAGTGPLPFYVSLAMWKDPSQSAADFLRSQFVARFGEDNHFSKSFHSLLHGGGLMLLLDGLNELPSRAPRRREELTDAKVEPTGTDPKRLLDGRTRASLDVREQSLLELAANDAVTATIVLTCRAHEYDHTFERSSRRWTLLELLPMEPAQVDEFVLAQRPYDGGRVLDVIRANRGIAGLTRNPYLLRSMVELDLETLSHVTDKAGLVGRLLDQALARSEVEPARNAAAVGQLGKVAYRMISDWMIGNQSALDLRSPEEFAAAELLASTPMLTHADGSFYFQHQIVQEYLAATWLSQRRRSHRPIRLLCDRRWSEIIVLWIQLDPQRAGRAVRRSLRARNLPWRRPRRASNPTVIALDFAVGCTIFVYLAVLALNWALGTTPALPAPTSWVGINGITLIIGLVVVRMVLKALSVHGTISANAAYVLAVANQGEALRSVFRAFRRTIAKERTDISASLGTIGRPVIEHCQAGLAHGNVRIRMGSVLTLGAVAERFPPLRNEVRPLLRAAARTPEARMIVPTVAAFVRAGDRTLDPALEGLLKAVETMNPLAVGFRFQPLAAMIDPTTEGWSPVFVASLCNMIQPSTPPPLLNAIIYAADLMKVPGLEDAYGSVAVAEGPMMAHPRQAAIRALGGCPTPRAAEHLRVAIARRTDKASLDAVARLDPRIDAHYVLLRQIVERRNSELTAVATRALGKLDGDRLAEALATSLRHRDPKVRQAALASCRAHEDLLLEHFGIAVDDPDGEVRRTAIDAVSTHVSPRRLSALAALAERAGHPERAYATRSLGEFGTAAVPVLGQLRGATERSVRRAARRALRQIDLEKRQHHHGARRDLGTRVRAGTFGPLLLTRSLVREERLAGSPPAEYLQRLQMRAFSDMPRARELKPVVRLASLGVLGTAFLLTVFGLALVRGGGWLGRLALDHLLVTGCVLAIGAASALVAARVHRGRLPGVAGAVRNVVILAAVLAGLGGLLFVWWIPIALGVLAAVVPGTIASVRSRRRRIRPGASDFEEPGVPAPLAFPPPVLPAVAASATPLLARRTEPHQRLVIAPGDHVLWEPPSGPPAPGPIVVSALPPPRHQGWPPPPPDARPEAVPAPPSSGGVSDGAY